MFRLYRVLLINLSDCLAVAAFSTYILYIQYTRYSLISVKKADQCSDQ